MNLNIRRVSHESTLTVALDSSSTVTSHSVCRKEVCVSVSTRCYYDSICRESLKLSCAEILCDDTACTTVNNNNVFHFITCIELHLASIHHARERRVSTKEELLSCLALCIERTAYLCTTERTVSKHTAIFTCERNTLSNTLVDDIVRNLCKAIYVCLTGTIVTTLYSVIEKTVYRVAIVLIVLGSVDTTLSRNRVCTTWRVLDTKVYYVEAHLTERSSCTGTSKTSTDNDYIELELVLWVYQTLVCLVVSPFFSYWSLWYS